MWTTMNFRTDMLVVDLAMPLLVSLLQLFSSSITIITVLISTIAISATAYNLKK